MDFIGEQGPFHDAIAGATDHTGWEYAVVRFCPVSECNGCELLLCGRCGEQIVDDEEWPDNPFCWNCDDPVPQDWEAQFLPDLFSRGEWLECRF